MSTAQRSVDGQPGGSGEIEYTFCAGKRLVSRSGQVGRPVSLLTDFKWFIRRPIADIPMLAVVCEPEAQLARGKGRMKDTGGKPYSLW